ncbi:MAG: RNB domain-containing ribonuclease [Burkholderiaceae bacterium]
MRSIANRCSSAGKRPRQSSFACWWPSPTFPTTCARVIRSISGGQSVDIGVLSAPGHRCSRKLSNRLCSLNPLVDRLVLVCDMVISNSGKLRAYQFYEAVMHSAARMTYDAVWGILSGREANAGDSADTPRSLGRAALEERLVALHEVFKVLMKARTERGALSISTRWKPRSSAIRQGASRRSLPCNWRCPPADRVHACGQRVQCRLRQASQACGTLPGARRPERKLALLRTFLKTTGLSLDGGDDPQPADFAALGQEDPRSPRRRPAADDDAALDAAGGVTTPINAGHRTGLSGLHLLPSPIRRYPDLLTTR